MIRRLFGLGTALSVFMLGIASCSDEPETPEIEQPDAEIIELETLGKQINQNSSSFQELVSMVESDRYVASIDAIYEDGLYQGITLVLSDGKSVPLYRVQHARTPKIGVSLLPDGEHYWTIDGNIAESAGNKLTVKACKPRVRIESKIWQISYDNGVSWEDLYDISHTSGLHAEQVEITQDTDFVYLRMADNNTMTLGKNAPSDTIEKGRFKIGGYDIKGIDDNGVIMVKIPYPAEVRNLTATFHLSHGCRLTVKGALQTSGVTRNNFSMPVEYVLEKPDGEKTTYKVMVYYTEKMPMIYIDTRNVAIASKEEYVENITVHVCNMGKYDGEFTQCRIKGRGNSSWNMPKKSYTLKLNKKETFLGMKKHKTFALVANYADKTLFRNSIVYQMGREVFTDMKWSPTSVFAHLIVNGEYYGLYGVTESVKIDANRVNIPNMEDCPSIDEADKYGYLIEANARLDEEFNFTTTTRKVPFSLKDPDGADISDALKQHIQNKIQSVEDAMHSADFNDPESPNYYFRYLDVPSFVDWYLANEITKNNDAIFWSSCFLYFDPADNLIHMGPLWDFDISCGNINYNGSDNPEGWRIKTSEWIKQLFKDKVFADMVRKRFDELTPAVRSFIVSEIPTQARNIREDAAINFCKWEVLGKYIWPSAPGYAQRTTYESEVDYLTNWLQLRMEWLDKNL